MLLRTASTLRSPSRTSTNLKSKWGILLLNKIILKSKKLSQNLKGLSIGSKIKLFCTMKY